MDLRHYLFEKNMTNGAFARKAGLCAQYITQLKLRRVNGSLETLTKIILAGEGLITPTDVAPELFEAWELAKNPPAPKMTISKTGKPRGRPKKEVEK